MQAKRAEKSCDFRSELCYKPAVTLDWGTAMGTGALLLLAFSLCWASLASAQASTAIDLRTNERELQRYQWQLQQDRNRLMFDRRNHAPRLQIREDQAQIHRDKAALKTLRAEIRRDRRARKRYRTL